MDNHLPKSKRNHLLIGLGGTGGKVLKAFRKSVHEEFRDIDPPKETGVYTKYLYVDSSSADLRSSEEWRTQGDIGAFIGLPAESRFAINTNSLVARLADPQNNPVTFRYIGNVAFWGDIFASRNLNEAAGGQIRRLGVALFEPNALPFIQHVTRAVTDLNVSSGQAGAAFHIFAGLAGGTGSGTFLHVIAQLRSQYPDGLKWPIYLYLLLPEDYAKWAANGNATNYYANGYAALQELNAYLVSNNKGDSLGRGSPLFTPIDLTNNTTRFESLDGINRLTDRLQGCFLVSTTNEKDHVLPVEEVPELMAQLLYQRVFVVDHADDSYRLIKDAVSLENFNLQDETKKTDGNIGQRSLRFQSFGIKRYVIPEEEIREYCTARFARQAALQMRYNNWSSGLQGLEYLGQAQNISFNNRVREDDNLRLWKLTDDHLKLNTPILRDEEKYQWANDSIEKHWQDIVSHLKSNAWSQPAEQGRDKRLDTLDRNFKIRFDSNFRNLGVISFYKLKRDELDKSGQHISEIHQSIENWMFIEWQEGRLSVTDLEHLLDALLSYLEDRHSRIATTQQELKSGIEELNQKLDTNRKTWDDIGILWRERKQVACFEERALLLRNLYEKRTLQTAWSFAERLLERLIAELRDSLKADLATFRNGLDNAIDFFRIHEESTVKDKENNTNDPYINNVIKFYDPAKVKSVVRSLLENEQQQQAWAGKVRRTFINNVDEIRRQSRGSEKFFASFVNYGLTNGELKRILEKVSSENSDQAHTDQIGINEKLFGVNIVSKMAEDFPNMEHLRNHVSNLVNKAQTFMQYERNEFNGGIGPKSILAILLPECQEKSQFRNQLKQIFINEQPAGVEVSVIDTNHKTNEITLISLKYGFPLRYLQPIHTLKRKYDFRLTQGSRERAILELHIEDHHPDLPSLLRPPPGEAGNKVIPLLSLATTLELMNCERNPMSGENEYVISIPNEHGTDQEHFYSEKLVSIMMLHTSQPKVLESSEVRRLLLSVTDTDVEALQTAIDIELKKDKYRLADNRNELKNKLRLLPNLIKQNRGNSSRDEIYIQFKNSVDDAIRRVDTIFS